MNGIILCGFAGIGKSYVAKNRCGWVDLESTPFNKDFNTYITIANHMSSNGYNVMLSAHKELRQLLLDNDIKFITIMPTISQLNEYKRRYKERGSSNLFIKKMAENWDEYNKIIDGEIVYYLKRKSYYLDTKLDDIIKYYNSQLC